MVLLTFAVFFVVPLARLVLAPTKTDSELLTRNPFAFGSLHNVWDAWQRVDGSPTTSSGDGWRTRSRTR
jgi:multiple sugar transport system permease protein